MAFEVVPPDWNQNDELMEYIDTWLSETVGKLAMGEDWVTTWGESKAEFIERTNEIMEKYERAPLQQSQESHRTATD